MSTFEYLSVFVSIVIGLGVANVLMGLARVLTGPREEISVVHLTWVGLVLLLQAFFWWFTYDWRLQETWTFPLFLWVVAYSMLVFFLAALVIPAEKESGQSWEEAFLGRRRLFFSVWGLTILADVSDAALRGGTNLEELGGGFLLIQAISLVLAGVLALGKGRRLFVVLTVAQAVIMTGAILEFADVFRP